MEFKATVKSISSSSGVCIVKFDAGGVEFSMASLNVPSLHVKDRVVIGAKFTNIIVSDNLSTKLAITNRFVAILKGVERGELLCRMRLQFLEYEFECLVTKEAFNELSFEINSEVLVFINPANLFVKKIL